MKSLAFLFFALSVASTARAESTRFVGTDNCMDILMTELPQVTLFSTDFRQGARGCGFSKYMGSTYLLYWDSTTPATGTGRQISEFPSGDPAEISFSFSDAAGGTLEITSEEPFFKGGSKKIHFSLRAQ
jgi:hypothetical protein